MTLRQRFFPEYTAWAGMKSRCSDPNSSRYPYYGGRGIKVCDRWRDSFAAFLVDVGPRPSPDHSLDRMDPNGNYEPGAVRWATRKEQQRNRRNNRFLTIFGQRRTLAEWAEIGGLHPYTLLSRINAGWHHGNWFSPVRRKRRPSPL